MNEPISPPRTRLLLGIPLGFVIFNAIIPLGFVIFYTIIPLGFVIFNG